VINKGKLTAIGSPAYLKRKFSGSEVLEVSFTEKNAMTVEDISKIPGVIEVSQSGGSFKIIVSDPLLVMEELARRARSRHASLNYINLRGADAEEVFLRDNR
ncbi:MAG: hypothetical protein J7K49_00210, partial [Thaumarchaeota archaeon]|nr:hypothetical protein [Nitrososphaerota archaeon]